jgi:protoporphyrinogen oxidase
MARKIVVIGGGLSGLAAAWELEQQHADYTLIEVKPRLGGSIITQTIGGFVLDGGAFVHEKYDDWAFLDELNLRDQLKVVSKYRDGELVIFRDGTQVLTDALARRITQPLMTRMAVSSIGHLDDGRYGVCLENGLLLEAAAVIVAAPARHAAHILRELAPHNAEYLLDYQYEPIARVSLGYLLDNVPASIERPDGGLFRFVETYTFASRVPAGHVLVRAGVRLNVKTGVTTPQQALAAAKRLLPDAAPTAEWVTYWAEDFPLTRALPEHRAAMDALDAELPRGVRVVGSDYRAKRINEQVEQGRAAARYIFNDLFH